LEAADFLVRPLPEPALVAGRESSPSAIVGSVDFGFGPSVVVEDFTDFEPRRLAAADVVLLPRRWIVCFPPGLDRVGCFFNEVGVDCFCGFGCCCCC